MCPVPARGDMRHAMPCHAMSNERTVDRNIARKEMMGGACEPMVNVPPGGRELALAVERSLSAPAGIQLLPTVQRLNARVALPNLG